MSQLRAPSVCFHIRPGPTRRSRGPSVRSVESRTSASKRGSDSKYFSSGEVGQDREVFFDSPADFSRCVRAGRVNQSHWESHKSDCVIRNCETIVLQLPRVRAGKRLRADVDFRIAPLRSASSNARCPTPMIPTCRADELHTGGPSAYASDARRGSNISTTHERTEC